MEFYYHSVDNDVLILSADGGLMSDSAPHFVGQLERYIELGSRRLIVDCAKLTRISSCGVGILVSLHNRLAKQGGDVKLASVSGLVGKVLGMTGLGAMFEIYPTVEDARLAFSGGDAGSGEDGVDSRHPHLD